MSSIIYSLLDGSPEYKKAMSLIIASVITFSVIACNFHKVEKAAEWANDFLTPKITETFNRCLGK